MPEQHQIQTSVYADVVFRIPVPGPFTYIVPEKFQATVAAGARVRAPFGGRKKLTGIVVAVSTESPDYECKELDAVIDPFPLLTPELMDLGAWMANYYLCSQGEAYGVMSPKGKRLTGPLKAEFDRFLTEAPESFEPVKEALPQKKRSLQLNAEQQKVLQGLYQNAPRGRDVHVVFGITGSGKTEVYIDAALRTLQAGQSVIILVPEITLTVQLVKRLEAVFGPRLAVLHSYLPVSEKFHAWMRIRLGMADVVLGTRSAVFAPVQNLGLIVMDEEHDASYKEHSAPRYHARQIALKRAASVDAKVVLGSATPSIETYYWARDQTRFRYHRLLKRAQGASPPGVTVVPRAADRDFLSPELLAVTAETVSRGEQAIFLLNRRGYSPQAYCSRCKDTLSCPACSVSLTYHRNGSLLCHLCGYAEVYKGRCPSCTNQLELVGVGTQKAEEMVEKALPDIRIRRLDQDSVTRSQTQNLVSDTLTALGNHEFDILLGTQMIAKGLDFENVTLVAVLNADVGLGLPDFRASERIFSLLVQVAGRAGRASKPGQVIIQSITPALPLLKQATSLDYEAFYRDEIEMRRSAGFPPFTRMIRIVFRSKSEDRLLNHCDRFRSELAERLTHKSYMQWSTTKQAKQEAVSLDTFLNYTHFHGPLEAPIVMHNTYFRWHVLIKTIYPETTKALIAHLQQAPPLKKGGVAWQVDIDPLDMM